MTGPSQLINDFAKDTLKFANRILKQNNSYEITINGFQVRKINEIRKVIFVSSSSSFDLRSKWKDQTKLETLQKHQKSYCT